MNKMNKVLMMLILVLGIVLISSVTVYADVTGSGTKDDPYIIDGKEKNVELTYESLPIYYKFENMDDGVFNWKDFKGKYHVGNTYKINSDEKEKKITFTKLYNVNIDDKGNTNYKVILSKDRMNEIFAEYYTTRLNGQLKHYSNIVLSDKEYEEYLIGSNVDYLDSQLGITYIKEEKGMPPTSEPLYDIKEIVTFESEKDIDDRSTIGTKKNKIYTRKLTLDNVAVELTTGMINGMEDAYYFTSSKGASYNSASLFVPQYYRNIIQDKGNNALLLSREDDDGKTTLRMWTNRNYNIVYEFNGFTKVKEVEEDDAGFIEKMVTKLLAALGDVLLDMLQGAIGQDLTIDSLIFNKFEKTKLDLYNSNSSSNITSVLKEVVNSWFGIFSKFAYVCYVILLVYIGIMVITFSGTDKQSRVKELLSNWITGLALLLIIPTFGLPAIIKLNDAFVTYIGANYSKIETYYNFYNPELEKEIFGKTSIMGGDSYTYSLEQLEGKRIELTGNKDEYTRQKREIYVTIAENVLDVVKVSTNAYKLQTKMRPNYEAQFRSKFLSIISLKTTFRNKLSKESFKNIVVDAYKIVALDFHGSDNSILAEVLIKHKIEEMWPSIEANFKKIEELDEQIEYVEKMQAYYSDSEDGDSTDLMSTMRKKAGGTGRLIYAIVWWMLIFQLISLTFIYFKRIFVLAILIAVFPIIMVFYGIDKMADGKSQTLSLWFKEILSNIFIQSVHVVIYSVLVETGLKIYEADNSNWILFMAAILLIIPAEKILKEIFGLNGSTLGQLGGSALKAAALIGAGVATVKNLFGRNGKSFSDSVNKKNARLQKSQNRADDKKMKREAKRSLKSPTGSTKPTNIFGKAREGMYKVGTAARKGAAAALPTAAHVAKGAKKAVGTSVGLMYGIASGGSPEDMLTGARAASAFINNGNKKNKKDELKKRVTSAYDKKKE